MATPSPRLDPTDKRLVDLDSARQSVPPGTDHGPPQLVQPDPSRPVASKAQNSLQPDRIGSVLLAGQPPHRAKPQTQALMSLAKDRPCGQRNLLVTAPALQPTPGCAPSNPALTPGAPKAIRPAQGHQVSFALRLRPKAILEFKLGAWVVLGGRCGIHTPSIAQPELSAYPFALNIPAGAKALWQVNKALIKQHHWKRSRKSLAALFYGLLNCPLIIDVLDGSLGAGVGVKFRERRYKRRCDRWRLEYNRSSKQA